MPDGGQLFGRQGVDEGPGRGDPPFERVVILDGVSGHEDEPAHSAAIHDHGCGAGPFEGRRHAVLPDADQQGAVLDGADQHVASMHEGPPVEHLLFDQDEVRRQRQARALARGGPDDYRDETIFATVESVLSRAVDRNDPEALILPQLVDADEIGDLQLPLKFQSHRRFVGPAIIFFKKRLLLPLTHWLYEYSLENFRRQQRINRLLFAAVEELALENARLRAILRRQRPQPVNLLRVGDLELDLVSRTAARAGEAIDLTNREFALLEFLMSSSPRPVSKTAIVEHVWDQHFDSQTNVVNVYIAYLRRKVDRPGLPPLLHTLRGIGFALRENAP